MNDSKALQERGVQRGEDPLLGFGARPHEAKRSAEPAAKEIKNQKPARQMLHAKNSPQECAPKVRFANCPLGIPRAWGWLLSRNQHALPP